MAESNENADLENLEEGAEGEEEDTSTDDAAEDEGAEGEEDTGADDEGDEGDGEDDEDGEEDDDADDEFTIPEKFKGKDAKAIAKSYVELEKSLEKKVAAKVREEIAKQRPGGKAVKADDEAIKKAMEGVDFTKMKPEDFAAWLIKTVEARAQEIARTTYETADSTKQQIQTDIAAVQKTWPAIKDNENFRNIVLTLIENKASKGEIMTLKEAAKEAGKMLGIKPGAAAPAGDGKGEGEGKKRPKTGVERASGSGGGDKQTDEESVLAGILGGAKVGANGPTIGALY